MDEDHNIILTPSQVLLESSTGRILIGGRDPATRLWIIYLCASASVCQQLPAPTLLAYNTYTQSTLQKLAKNLHKAVFSPVTSTWIEAIDAERFSTWPGLTSNLVHKYLPESRSTALGHICEVKQYISSTTKTTTISTTPTPADTLPSASSKRTHIVFLKQIEITGRLLTDQTGRFHTTSSLGSKYFMIAHDRDSNAILAHCLKTRSEQELKYAYKAIFEYVTNRGLRPKFQVMDNEFPQGSQTYMTEQHITFQLVPPHYHRNNPDEKSIGAWKEHF